MSFQVLETTIEEVHKAYLSGELTARQLVQAYLDRIAAYDKSGPSLNSILAINADALKEADRLDAELKATGKLSGPLHGVPVVVKDQAETAGIKTTFGSIAVDNHVPTKDATAVAQIKKAGAIILAKTTMPDFATSWFSYSSQSGTTKNPYDLARDPGGSSSGTGSSLAANLGLVGIGEDTGGSIRLPGSFCSLVGIRVTPGLISRHGMSPLVVFQDTAGPMARTVKDAAILLDSMVGYDPLDEYTSAFFIGRSDKKYSESISKDSLSGARIGVVREAFGDNSDPDCASVNKVIENSLELMKKAGAILVDVELPNLMDYIVSTSLYVTQGRSDMNGFFAKHPNFEYRTVEAIIEAKKYHPKLELLEAIAGGPSKPTDDPEFFPKLAEREKFQRAIVNAMAKANVEALVYPTMRIVAPTHEETDGPRWTVLNFPTNTLIAAQAWLPAATVPAGATPAGLPVGLEMVGLPYGESKLISLAYSFEQNSKLRVTPKSTPAL
jgi:amidase